MQERVMSPLAQRWHSLTRLPPAATPPQALTGGLTEALLTLLLRDASDAGAQAHVSLALRRCGAADLAGEVAALASDLGAVAAAGEAACRAWYAALAADLL